MFKSDPCTNSNWSKCVWLSCGGDSVGPTLSQSESELADTCHNSPIALISDILQRIVDRICVYYTKVWFLTKWERGLVGWLRRDHFTKKTWPKLESILSQFMSIRFSQIQKECFFSKYLFFNWSQIYSRL